MSTVTLSAPLNWGWIRGPAYDSTLIFGVAALALASGLAVVVQPDLFLPILIADLWLLGYHHVVATFTRIAFDRASRRKHRFHLTVLPVIVLVGTVGLATGFGLWVLTSTYLYWQWFHYTRQSWGVAEVYRRKTGTVQEDSRLIKAAFYLVPLWGILHRSAQQPDTFLGADVKVVPIPWVVVDVVGVLAVGVFVVWALRRAVDLSRGRGAPAHTAYMISHFLVFMAGYIFIEDITHGWLVINVWHNAQYVLFVWLFNSNRFKDGVDPNAKFLSWLSQPHRYLGYFLVCIAISTAVYAIIAVGVALGLVLTGFAAAIIVYQTINFHHYIVDSVIWKVRQSPIQKVLGLS